MAKDGLGKEVYDKCADSIRREKMQGGEALVEIFMREYRYFIR
jgi:hypothetical protein